MALSDTKKRTILLRFVGDLISVAKTSGYAAFQAQAVALLAYLAESEEGAVAIEQLGGLEVLVALATSAEDIVMRERAARALVGFSRSAAVRGKFVAHGGIVSLRNLSQSVPLTRKTRMHLMRAVAYIAESEQHDQKLISQFGFEELRPLVELQDVPFQAAIAKFLARVSNTKSRAKIKEEGGFPLVKELAKSKDPVTATMVTKCMANLAQDPKLSYQIVKDHGLDVLASLQELQNKDVTLQVARCIANLAANEQVHMRILEKDWLRTLVGWLGTPPSDRIYAASVVALGNLAINETVASAMIELDVLKPLLHQLHSKSPFIDQVTRVVTNLSRHDDLASAVFSRFQENISEWASGNLATKRQMASALANFAANEQVSYKILGQEEIWNTILELSTNEDIEIQRHMARSFANLAVNVAPKLRSNKQATELLEKWLYSSDIMVSSHAIRARASLATLDISGAKYADGIYLLYPETADAESDFDIIFVHGVTGHPTDTWRQLTLEDQEPISYLPDFGGLSMEVTSRPKNPEVSIWPRDWIPEDFPKARVLTVGYNLFLSKWAGDALPLEDQSLELLKKLKLAAVGSRPIIWVTHSFGGLLVKDMLRFSSQNGAYSCILTNTKGIVFFSTPHRGSDITSYADVTMLNTVFRGTVAIEELKPSSARLSKLTDEFPTFAPHVATLSFGENDKTCIGSKYACFQIVSDESANPGFLGPNHRFLKTNYNHREVCKPKDRQALQYQMVLEFIRSQVA